MRLILASGSARRAELLTSAGFEFEIQPADVGETPRENELAEAYTVRVAREKAQTIRQKFLKSDAVILAADTEVIASGRILGKPINPDAARRMLRMMSGATHDVLTAVVVLARSSEQCTVVTTRVHFTAISEGEMDAYIQTGEPMGKAGAYGIQGYAARFIDHIEGSWSNVVGLPIHAVHGLLANLRE